MKKNILWLVILVVVVGGLIWFATTRDSEEDTSNNTTTEQVDSTPDPVVQEQMDETAPSEDTESKNITNTVIQNVNELSFQYEGELEDVSGGEAFGTARATFVNGEYTMQATFGDLPPLEDGFFYEGWVVRKGADFNVISSGVVNEVNGQQQNIYRSAQDLTDHDFYVLTLEPDDGDPAPAEHILEGTMVQIAEKPAVDVDESVAAPTRKGEFIDYDTARLSDADDGQVVLFFHAAWCPTCIVAAADITAKSEDIPAGMTIMKVDFDSETALKRQHGVTYQHTFVQVDSEGNQLKKWSGGDLDLIIDRAI